MFGFVTETMNRELVLRSSYFILYVCMMVSTKTPTRYTAKQHQINGAVVMTFDLPSCVQWFEFVFLANCSPPGKGTIQIPFKWISFLILLAMIS